MQSPIRRWVPRRCRRGRTSAPLPTRTAATLTRRHQPFSARQDSHWRSATTCMDDRGRPARRIVDSMVLLRLPRFVRLAICDPEGLCRQSNSSLSVSKDGPYELLSIGPTARPWSMPTSPPTSVATALVGGR
jgi:hypothetical protein